MAPVVLVVEIAPVVGDDAPPVVDCKSAVVPMLVTLCPSLMGKAVDAFVLVVPVELVGS